MQNREADLVGRTLLGRYRVLSHLGAGGMGSVYLARSQGAAGFSKPVVLKHIHPSLTVDPAASAMFIREARILSDFQHSGIVGVLDFGEEDGRYVMVLEYVHGYDLAQWANYHCQKGRAFPLDLAVHLSQRVLAALHHAHTHTWADGTRMSIVHRDVSPGNVLLDLDGQVKLADFGVARICDEQVERHTRSTQFKGKFAYGAPELLEGGSASPQSDVYAWGVVVYQLLSGSNPFREKRVADTVKRVLYHDPPPLSRDRPDLPTELDAVLARALSKKREERYADAAEFAQALKPLSLVSAEEAQKALAEAVRRDFLGDMPAVLGIAPLAERESAWRDESGGRGVAELTSTPPAPNHEGETVVEFKGVTADTQQTAVGEPPPALVSGARLSSRPAAGVEKGSSKAVFVAVAIGAVALLGAAIAIALALRSHSTRAPQVLIVERRTVSPKEAAASGTVPLPPAEVRVEQGTAVTMPSTSAVAQPENSALPRAGGAAARQTDDAARLSRAVQRHRGDFVGCFEQHVEAVEGAPQLTVNFTVGEAGRVMRASVAPATVTGTPLGSCVLSVARGIQFPALGREVSFSVPITAHVSR